MDEDLREVFLRTRFAVRYLWTDLCTPTSRRRCTAVAWASLVTNSDTDIVAHVTVGTPHSAGWTNLDRRDSGRDDASTWCAVTLAVDKHCPERSFAHSFAPGCYNFALVCHNSRSDPAHRKSNLDAAPEDKIPDCCLD